MVLGQTGQHISGYFRHRFDAELASLNAALANIKNTLDAQE
jgi:hypothetical protein